MAQRQKPWSQAPSEAAVGTHTQEWMNWVTSQLNQLGGQGNVNQGIGVTSLASGGTIVPSTVQLTSIGARPQSVTSSLIAIPQPTIITFYWDGTNGSSPLSIYRDDGTSVTPIYGNLAVTGLSPSTTYFFYPFYQESTILTSSLGFGISQSGNLNGTQLGINFAFIPGATVGTPPIAYTRGNIKAAALQLQRDHIPLSLNFAVSGVATTAAGTGAAVSGGPGGGGGSAGAGRYANL